MRHFGAIYYFFFEIWNGILSDVFSKKIYTTKNKYFCFLFFVLENKKRMLHFIFSDASRTSLCTISALVVCAILGELSFLKKIWNSKIFCTFSSKFIPQNKHFYEIKENKRAYVHNCTWVFTGMPKTSYNFGSPVKWRKRTYDYIAQTRRFEKSHH